MNYFLNNKWSETDLIYLGARVAVNFLHSLAYCHGQETNEEFFKVMRRFIVQNIDTFNKFQLIKLLDIYKYNQHWGDSQSGAHLKMLMENKLEIK